MMAAPKLMSRIGRRSGKNLWTGEIDPIQASYLKEELIQVDYEDRVIGSISKKDAHLWEKVEGQSGGVLHRAFSVFIFNSKAEMLLQRRSMAKITFPGFWTNACCSHPLNSPQEMEEGLGIKRAAKRRLQLELGFDEADIEMESLLPLTKILYKARCSPPRQIWAEHELDHVLVLPHFDILPRPNPNEVSEIRFVSPAQLNDMMLDGGWLYTDQSCTITNIKLVWFQIRLPSPLGFASFINTSSPTGGKISVGFHP